MNKNPMFRYLEKYIGTYRVLAPVDQETNDFPRDEQGNIEESFDDLYIDCAKGLIKHSYDPYYLVWYSDRLSLGRNVKKEFESHHIDIHDYEETDSEVLIYFDAKLLDKVAKIVKPKTQGKKISPYSDRGRQEKTTYYVPDKDAQKYSEVTKDLDRSQKLVFGRKIIKDFDDVIISKKGKKFNLKKDRDDSGLPNREYIHYIGMWDDFVDFARKKYAEIYK